jgi:hypothetical protein
VELTVSTYWQSSFGGLFYSSLENGPGLAYPEDEGNNLSRKYWHPYANLRGFVFWETGVFISAVARISRLHLSMRQCTISDVSHVHAAGSTLIFFLQNYSVIERSEGNLIQFLHFLDKIILKM